MDPSGEYVASPSILRVRTGTNSGGGGNNSRLSSKRNNNTNNNNIHRTNGSKNHSNNFFPKIMKTTSSEEVLSEVDDDPTEFMTEVSLLDDDDGFNGLVDETEVYNNLYPASSPAADSKPSPKTERNPTKAPAEASSSSSPRTKALSLSSQEAAVKNVPSSPQRVETAPNFTTSTTDPMAKKPPPSIASTPSPMAKKPPPNTASTTSPMNKEPPPSPMEKKPAPFQQRQHEHTIEQRRKQEQRLRELVDFDDNGDDDELTDCGTLDDIISSPGSVVVDRFQHQQQRTPTAATKQTNIDTPLINPSRSNSGSVFEESVLLSNYETRSIIGIPVVSAAQIENTHISALGAATNSPAPKTLRPTNTTTTTGATNNFPVHRSSGNLPIAPSKPLRMSHTNQLSLDAEAGSLTLSKYSMSMNNSIPASTISSNYAAADGGNDSYKKFGLDTVPEPSSPKDVRTLDNTAAYSGNQETNGAVITGSESAAASAHLGYGTRKSTTEQLSALQSFLQLPMGLAKTVHNSKSLFPLRFWLVDNSAGMNATDCHTLDAAGTGIISCTRWVELQDTIDYQIRLADTIGARTVFRMSHVSIGASNRNEFIVASSSESASTMHEVNYALDTIRQAPTMPDTRNVLPLSSALHTVQHRLQSKATGGKRAIVVITACWPATDITGAITRETKQELCDSLRHLQGIGAQIVIRLSSTNGKVVEYYTRLQKYLRHPIEYIFDYMDEAREIYKNNRWLNYAEPLRRCREMGIGSPLFFTLTHRQLGMYELRKLLVILFGEEAMRCVPDAESNWDEFYTSLYRIVDAEGRPFNPITLKSSKWIDMKLLQKAYGTQQSPPASPPAVQQRKSTTRPVPTPKHNNTASTSQQQQNAAGGAYNNNTIARAEIVNNGTKGQQFDEDDDFDYERVCI